MEHSSEDTGSAPSMLWSDKQWPYSTGGSTSAVNGTSPVADGSHVSPLPNGSGTLQPPNATTMPQPSSGSSMAQAAAAASWTMSSAEASSAAESVCKAVKSLCVNDDICRVGSACPRICTHALPHLGLWGPHHQRMVQRLHPWDCLTWTWTVAADSVRQRHLSFKRGDIVTARCDTLARRSQL